MSKYIKKGISTTPIGDSLSDAGTYADNELQDALEDLNFFSKVKKCGISKRSGAPIAQVMFAILIWPLLLRYDPSPVFVGNA